MHVGVGDESDDGGLERVEEREEETAGRGEGVPEVGEMFEVGFEEKELRGAGRRRHREGSLVFEKEEISEREGRRHGRKGELGKRGQRGRRRREGESR